MGHGLDLIDIDPRNDGDVERGRAQRDLPRVYLQAYTPQVAGTTSSPHWGCAAATTSCRASTTRPGTAPARDGGHGFAFIAPDGAASKETGELVPYRWTFDDLDALDGAGDDGERAAGADRGRGHAQDRR